jgi:hypothetical protein
MPRIKLNYQQSVAKTQPNLVLELKHCLEATRSVGQPLVYEYELQHQLVRVLVIWDKWRSSSLENRTAIILAAYQDQADQEVALASGLTIPEAVIAGFLPFRIIAALRKGDSLGHEDCWKVMLKLGASQLFEDEPRLYFATRKEAEKMIEALSQQLPGSEEIWQIIQEAGSMAQEDIYSCL